MKPLPSSSPHQIGTLLLTELSRSKLSPSEFVQRAGYKNTTKALRRLSEWINDGRGSPDILDRLATLDPSLRPRLDDALRKDAHAAQLAAARAFTPYLEARVESHSWDLSAPTRPSQITMYCLVNGDARRRQSVPALDRTRPLEHQLGYLSERITEHFTKSAGEIPFFGPIRSYLLWLTPNDAVRFSPEGVMTENPAAGTRGEACLTIGKRAVPKEVFER